MRTFHLHFVIILFDTVHISIGSTSTTAHARRRRQTHASIGKETRHHRLSDDRRISYSSQTEGTKGVHLGLSSNFKSSSSNFLNYGIVRSFVVVIPQHVLPFGLPSPPKTPPPHPHPLRAQTFHHHRTKLLSTVSTPSSRRLTKVHSCLVYVVSITHLDAKDLNMPSARPALPTPEWTCSGMRYQCRTWSYLWTGRPGHHGWS